MYANLRKSPITIYTTDLSYRIKMESDSHLIGTTLKMGRFFDRFTHMKYDFYTKRWVVSKKFIYYNRRKKTLHVPKYDLPRFLDFLHEYGQEYILKDIPKTPGVSISLKLKDTVNDRSSLQTEAIEYLSQKQESSLKGLAMQTGAGKTYSAIKAVCTIGRRAIICVPGMVDQWARGVKEYTQATDDDIYVIQGSVSIAKLLKTIDKTLFPSIILCSLSTIRNYCMDNDKYADFPDFEEFLHLIGVGVKITDEVHLNFYLNLMLDLRWNPSTNIVMTATFDNSVPTIKTIFDSHYPEGIRFGESQYDKYAAVHEYHHATGPYTIPSFAYKSQEGYSHTKLESFLLKKKGILNNLIDRVYLTAIYSRYINIKQDGDKLLILCSTVSMCEYMKDYLDRVLSSFGFNISIYISETDDDVLTTADVIISTPKSAGTGRDIKRLLTVVCTISIRSAPLNEQILGRLRKLPDGRTPQFAYFVNDAISPQVEHGRLRLSLFGGLCKEFTTTRL